VKTKIIMMTIALFMFCAGTGLAADTQSNDEHSYIGVMLDPAPLPDLLVKHLNLEPGQGIRIANISRNSPADKAGLERDDIIIGFEGKNVDDRQQFIEDVRKAGIGTEVSLQIIHLGKRKTIKLKLESLKELESLKGDFGLIYTPEPQIVQLWRPGKIFKLRPGDDDWMEVFKDKMPSDLDVNIRKFFNEIYTYKHSDGEDYTITVEGNPNDVESTITVQVGDNEYKTTLKELDKLPEKYQKPAEQAIKDARKTATSRKFYQHFETPSFDWPSYFDKIRPDFTAPNMSFGPPNEMFEKIQKQMKELQQRLDKLEKQKKFDSDQSEEPKSQKQKDSPLHDKENEQVT